MLRTITIGSCVSVQGWFVRQLKDGQVIIRVGNRMYKGKPVTAMPAASNA